MGLCVTRDYSCMFLRVVTSFRMKHAFGVDVGSGQTFENRTLIPASTSTTLHPHPLLCQPPFRPKWALRTGTGTGTLERRCRKTAPLTGPCAMVVSFQYQTFSSTMLQRFFCEFM